MKQVYVRRDMSYWFDLQITTMFPSIIFYIERMSPRQTVKEE